jgi:hypothetical protein
VAYDSDSEMLRDIRYDVKYIPEDHYEEWRSQPLH